jgi:carboxymethylenebutenolidase
LIKNTIQGHYVHIDPFCPKTRVDKLKNQLGDQLEEYWYHLPHGIPHFFFKNDQGKKALQRMVTFMHQKLS